MSNPILTELAALWQETETFLTCPEPDSDTCERYYQRRQDIFSRLQDMFQHDVQPECDALQNVLTRVLAQDQLLLQQLEISRSRCRQELADIAKARQALKGYMPPLQVHLLERGV